ncbi:CENPX protein, partial [Probosciger aterrimus]|nr:CENPX protein [Probosciger aterrimus]
SRLPALLSVQETVDRLLRLHFRDGRTRVNGDAQLLMVEMLNVFVRGELLVPGPRCGAPFTRAQAELIPVPHPPSPWRSPSSLPSAEAAARAVRQAQAEDLEKVDVEHVEKVLPQLVRTG